MTKFSKDEIRVMCVFPGLGSKTVIGNQETLGVRATILYTEFDSVLEMEKKEILNNLEFESYILNLIERGSHNLIIVPCGERYRNILRKNKINYETVFPSLTCDRGVYIERLLLGCNKSGSYISRILDEWNPIVMSLHTDYYAVKKTVIDFEGLFYLSDLWKSDKKDPLLSNI
ncbi:MAG: hypothetical protein PHF63_00300 [Herbinix sp.]|nr:hypothetical protein [Herbinix sp.]